MLYSVRIAIAVLASGNCCVVAQEKTIDVGDRAPAWRTLEGTDGEFYEARDFESLDALVICFTSNTCPYSVDYEDRLIALQKKYSSTKVRLVAINSNATDGDSLKKMIERAEAKSFNFPYLRDDDQEVAKAFGAVYTPEFFVINAKGTVIYKGAMDDHTKAESVTKRYVELAIEAAVLGKMPKVTRTGARGCAVRFPRKRRRKPADESTNPSL